MYSQQISNKLFARTPLYPSKYMMDGGIRQKASARHTSVSAYIFRKRQTSVRQSFDEVPLSGLIPHTGGFKKQTGNAADFSKTRQSNA